MTVFWRCGTLADELERIAVLAAAQTGSDDVVSGVIPTEPSPGRRVYLCAFDGSDGFRSWLGVDEDGSTISDRRDLREAVTVAVLCEVAADAAGGGDLDALIAQLEELREREAPPGIEDAEAAASAFGPCSGSLRSLRHRSVSTTSASRRDGSSASSTRRRPHPSQPRCGLPRPRSRSSSARSRPATGCRSSNLTSWRAAVEASSRSAAVTPRSSSGRCATSPSARRRRFRRHSASSSRP